MKTKLFICAAATLAVASLASASPVGILQPGNPVIAFDSDISTGNSAYPNPGERPALAIDGLTGTKYLNFGNTRSGFIVIPGAPSTVQSFQLTTANDASERDPFSFNLFGTNSPVVSADNSNGLAEPWTLIGSGALSPPPAGSFQTPYTPTDVVNSTSYSAYKMIFPELRGSPAAVCCMQFSEVQFFTGPGATGSPILAPGNNIRAVDDPGDPAPSQSRYPTPNETPSQGIDQVITSKYLNFGREHSGLIVTPSVSAIVDGIQFTTANDFPSRDPALVTIYGTNDPITSPDNGFGNNENWTVIVANLPYASPAGRGAVGPLVAFPNGTAWTSYKIEVVDNVGPDSGTGGADSVQYAEVQLFTGAVPEPSVALLAIGGALVLAARRRR